MGVLTSSDNAVMDRFAIKITFDAPPYLEYNPPLSTWAVVLRNSTLLRKLNLNAD